MSSTDDAELTGAEPLRARLLVIDDDPLLRTMAAQTLRHGGFEVAEAENGEQALTLFEDAAFDLLLLYVLMPGLDGYETCTRLRRLPHGARVPIVMLTGLNDSHSIELAYQAGATDFIAKPINWTLLSHRVRYALRASAAAESAIRSRDRLERAQHLATMGGWEIVCANRRFICSPELARVMAAPPGAMSCATAEAFLGRVMEPEREIVRSARAAAERDGTPYQLTFSVERFDGVIRTVFEQAAPSFDRAGRQVGVEGITQDITDRIEAERRIRHLAHYDLLTGWPNRQFFDELANRTLDRAGRHGTACALLHVDMDNFKSVNDAVGQTEGDTVLVKMAERLQSSIRASDLASAARASGDWLVARVGGNAFTLLLVGIGNEQQAATIADRLLQAISEPIAIGDRDLVLTASIGIALFPRDASHAKGLTRCAEQAAYAAKGAGRARRRFFDEAMNASASARLVEEGDLRRAIAEGQLRLHYQPTVDARSGQIIGAEALVRWQHPKRGLVLPGQFIPLAESSDLILPLTDWVLETACADLRRRMNAGVKVVPVSVNLASPSFAHEGLLTQLDDLLARYQFEASWLTLEVTESLLMTDVEHAVVRLHELRRRGFGLSLDDFGTGYSSLSYLKRFPIDELKIDRSFIADMCGGGRDAAIAVSIIALGREFGLRVVAEGVETAAQTAFLLGYGCTRQQGFRYSRPVPGEAFDALLANGIDTLASARRKAATPTHQRPRAERAVRAPNTPAAPPSST